MNNHYYSCFCMACGECGVKHRTRDAAHRHLLRSVADCVSIPGGNSYSYRNVWRVTFTNTDERRYHRPHPDRTGFAEVGATWRELMGC